MNKTRKFIFLLTFFLAYLITNKVYAFNLKNEQSKIKANSSSGLHKPSYNPGGEEFANDKEFYEVYQKKYNSSSGSDYAEIDQNSDFFELGGAKLIEQTSVERLNNRELSDVTSKKFYCVSNSEIPEELMFLIESECEQEFKISNMNHSEENQIVKKQISYSQMQKKTGLSELENHDCEKLYSGKNQKELTSEESDEDEPLIKFKE